MSKISLYTKDFQTHLGDLQNCTECYVEEERNGLFDLTLICLISDPLYKKLEKENIIVTRANDTLLLQKFRIYNVKKVMKNMVQVYAKHISFDLAHDYIESINIERQSCEYALNQIFRNSRQSQHYRGVSDIIEPQDYNIENINPSEAIVGKEGSIIDTFGNGAEILRDNETISVLARRGNTLGYAIKYAENLTGFELEEDVSDLVTCIRPYATFRDQDTNQDKIIYGNYVTSPLSSRYSHLYIKSIDYSDKFEEGEVVTTTKLESLAEEDFRVNKVDIPKQNYKIEFVPLSKCVGYEDIEDKITLCDIVGIEDTRYDVNTEAKVIKAKYDVLRERYHSVELGDPKTALGDIIAPEKGEPGKDGKPGADGRPGTDAIYANLTNDSHTVPTLADGTSGNYKGCETTIELYKGATKLTGGVEYTVVAHEGITGNLVGNTYTVTNMAVDVGKVTLRASYQGKGYDKNFNISKSKKGSDGQNGKDAYTINISNDTHVFSCDSTGLITQEQETTTEITVFKGIEETAFTIEDLPSVSGLKLSKNSTTITIRALSGIGLKDNGSFDITIAVGGIKFKKSFSWSKARNGQDGNIENFPDELPTVPVITTRVYGLSTIDITWTYENKLYYTYELYASKTKDFTPNTFNLIHAGQSSSYLYQAQPDETWYFKVCGVNSHGRRTAFSAQATATTKRIEDLSNYVANAAIGDALIGTLSLDRGWVGQLRGNWIDAKKLSVTDGNGKRTLYVDDFGNVHISATDIKMIVAGEDQGVATHAQIQQSMREVQFRFEESGGYNKLHNSAFKDGLNHWTHLSWNSSGGSGGTSGLEIRQIGDEWALTNRNVLSAYAYNLTTVTGQALGIGFDSHNIWGGTQWTLSCMLGAHRANYIAIEICEYDSGGNRFLGNENSWRITNIKGGGQNRNNWIKFHEKFTLRNPGCAWFHVRVYLGDWNGETSTAYLFMAEPMLALGHKDQLMYTPNADELYSGITTVDKDGIKVQHEAGSLSRFNSKEMYQSNENGNRTISIRHGGLRTYQYNNDGNIASGFLGGITASRSDSSDRVYGNSVFGSSNCGYVTIGFSENGEDNQGHSVHPWLECIHYDGNKGRPRGIHTYKPLHVRNGAEFYNRPHMYYGVALPYEGRSDLNTEISYMTTSANASPGTRYLNIWGADGLQIGVQNGGYKIGHRMLEEGTVVGVHHEVWGNWNFNGWNLNNANVVRSLNNPIAPLSSNERRFTRESTAVMSTAKLIQDRGEDFTMDGYCMVEIPDDIKYSIARYDVNIIKYGPGDIWVSERTFDYFIVKSEKDIKFTWVLEGGEIKDGLARMASVNPGNFIDPPEEEGVFDEGELIIAASKYATMDDPLIEKAILIEELKRNNELWKLYLTN